MKRTLLFLLITLLCCGAFSVAVFAQSEVRYETGDVDKNTSVNIKDATLVQKHVAGLTTLSEDALLLADTDANGNVNVKDATLIQKVVAGIVEEFPHKDKPTEAPSQAPTSEPITTDSGVTAPSTVNPTDASAAPTTAPSSPPTQAPTQAPTKPSVDSDGYFDVIIRP